MTNGNPLQRIVVGAATTLLGAALVAGATGLYYAYDAQADVEELKKDLKAQQAVIVEIQKSAVALETSVNNIESRQKEDRDERRDAETRINDKLDELLRK